MANMFGLGTADAYSQSLLHMYQQGNIPAGAVQGPAAQMTPEHQAETIRVYRTQLAAAAAAVEQEANAKQIILAPRYTQEMMHQEMAVQQQQAELAALMMAQNTAKTTADGGDWLMAESAAHEAETPGQASDPMAAHRVWTLQHVKTMMSGGLSLKDAMLDAAAQAQKTGEAAIIETVRQTLDTMSAVDLSQ